MTLHVEEMIAEQHWDECRKLSGAVLCQDTTGFVAVDDSGAVHGMMVADSLTPVSANWHMGVDSSAVWKSGLHLTFFCYMFGTLGLLKLFGMTRSDNVKAIRLGERFGAHQTARLVDRYDVGVDGAVFEMAAEQCWALSWLRRAA